MNIFSNNSKSIAITLKHFYFRKEMPSIASKPPTLEKTERFVLIY